MLSTGRALTLEAAKAAFRESYEKWLAWAAAHPRDSDSGPG
jgi:hypothetical protein